MENKHQFSLSPLTRYLFGFGVLSVLVAGCVTNAANVESDGASASALSAPPPPATPVDAVIVQPHAVAETIEVTGTIVANQYVDIVSELTRKVVDINVKEGSHVKGGTLLFKLDDADLQAQLEKLRQQEKLALLNEQRLKDLLTHDAIAQQDYDQASTNLSVLKAQIRELQVALDKTRIVAPFSGQVGIIRVHRGAIVSVNTILTDIKDNGKVKVEFSVPEKYTNVIVPGSEHKFTTASSHHQFNARVTARDASLDENTRTLVVRALSDNSHGLLLHGQSARLTLTLHAADDVLTVSSNALIPSSQGYTVYRAAKGLVEPVAIQIGQRTATSVEVTQGLNKGDTIITSNILRLFPGAPVQFATLK